MVNFLKLVVRCRFILQHGYPCGGKNSLSGENIHSFGIIQLYNDLLVFPSDLFLFVFIAIILISNGKTKKLSNKFDVLLLKGKQSVD